MGTTEIGLVCNQTQLQVTNLRQSSLGPISLRNGRPLNRMEGNIRLRLPSNTTTSKDPTKTPSICQLQDDFSSTLLAQDALVSSRAPSRKRKKAIPTSSVKDTPLPDTGQRQTGLSPKPQSSETSRLATIKSSLISQGLSVKVSERVSSCLRPSTNTIYASRWKQFAFWCIQKKLDPFEAGIPEISDFMVYLFEEKKLAVSSIENYKSAIASSLSYTKNDCLNNNKTVTQLIRSFHIDRPLSLKTTPDWNLALVLVALSKPPFEPLQSIALANLSVKTIFLTSPGQWKKERRASCFHLQRIWYDR